jgi:hypothetical protein
MRRFDVLVKRADEPNYNHDMYPADVLRKIARENLDKGFYYDESDQALKMRIYLSFQENKNEDSGSRLSLDCRLRFGEGDNRECVEGTELDDK